MQNSAQPSGQDSTQGQVPPYSIPPAPTFASLGAHSMPFTGTLGSLAPGHQQQPSHQSVQGLSAAIPPSAYLMAQGQQLQQPYQLAAGSVQEKRISKKEESAFGLILPMHKVKRLIKSENSVKAVSGEASFAIAKATELLVEHLVERAYHKMVSERRDAIHYDDVATAVSKWPATDFLRGEDPALRSPIVYIVPQTMCLSELMDMAKREAEAERA